MSHLLITIFSILILLAFSEPVYKVDKATRSAAHIILGEIYKVELLDNNGNIISNLNTHASKENQYKIKNHIRILETIYGTNMSKDFTIERPLPAYYGKEHLREGLKLFYFLKKDGTPILGKYEFQTNQRARILKILKTKQ